MKRKVGIKRRERSRCKKERNGRRRGELFLFPILSFFLLSFAFCHLRSGEGRRKEEKGETVQWGVKKKKKGFFLRHTQGLGSELSRNEGTGIPQKFGS